MSNPNFWDHLANMAGHLFEAKQAADAEAQAQRAAKRESRPAGKRARVPDASPAQGFSGGAAPAECCITKRKVKL